MTQLKRTEKIAKLAKYFNTTIKQRKHKSMIEKQALAHDLALQHKIKPEFFINLVIQNDRNLYYR